MPLRGAVSGSPLYSVRILTPTVQEDYPAPKMGHDSARIIESRLKDNDSHPIRSLLSGVFTFAKICENLNHGKNRSGRSEETAELDHQLPANKIA